MVGNSKKSNCYREKNRKCIIFNNIYKCLCILRWHYRCINLLSMIIDPEETNVPVVLLSHVYVSQAIGSRLFVDMISFKPAGDSVVEGLLASEKDFNTGL